MSGHIARSGSLDCLCRSQDQQERAWVLPSVHRGRIDKESGDYKHINSS